MNIQDGDLAELFSFFARMKADIDSYKQTSEVQMAQDRCIALMSRDYLVSLIPNTFCPTYPDSIILLGDLSLDGERPSQASEILAHEEFGEKLKEMMEASKVCRCRQRIPTPVLTMRGKTIARSAGLSEALEIAYETGSLNPFKYAVGLSGRQLESSSRL